MMVDSSAANVEGRKRQRPRIAEKRRIAELAMLPGASVAGVARQHGVNANMVHHWRNLYRQSRLGEKRDDSIRRAWFFAWIEQSVWRQQQLWE
jgi:transposase-like protein